MSVPLFLGALAIAILGGALAGLLSALGIVNLPPSIGLIAAALFVIARNTRKSRK